MVINLSTSSDDALYLYQVLKSVLMGFRVIEQIRNHDGQIAEQTDRQTDSLGQADYYRTFADPNDSVQQPN